MLVRIALLMAAAALASTADVSEVQQSIQSLQRRVLLVDAPPQNAPAQKPQPAPTFMIPDPARIKIGMSQYELLRLFGPPAAKISGSESEIWLYSSNQSTLTIEFENGRVKRQP